MFAGTLSSCSLKTRDDAARGTGRDSAALSHEVQHVQRERERESSEPQVGELEEGGNRVCRNDPRGHERWQLPPQMTFLEAN